jgi:hypothetical protein
MLMQEFVTPSGLAVAAEDRDERELERELKRLDPDLFLTRELHRASGRWSYAVYDYQGPDRPPIHVLYWTHDRTLAGTPLPLSTGVYYEVESRKRNLGVNLAQQAHEENERRRREDIARADAERDEDLMPYFRRRLRLGSGQNSQRYFPLDERHVRRPADRMPKDAA